MKYIILAMAFVSLLPWAGFAQLAPQYAPCGQCNANPPVYGAPLVFQTHSIVSDYGMRVVAEGSRFHQGVDYGAPSANGDAVISLVEGRVTLISESNSTDTTRGGNHLKKIVINGRYRQTDTTVPTNSGGLIFAYLHLFDDRLAGNNGIRSGGFVIMRVPTNARLLTIINLQTQTALCETAGIVFTYNGTQYTTENYVQAGQLIAPIGQSGRISTHLHLALLEEGTNDRHLDRSIDAWNEVNHENNDLDVRLRRRDAAGFNRAVCEYNQGTPAWGTLVPNYTDNTRNILEMEISMPNATHGNPSDRYTNVCMNEARLHWQMQKGGSGAFLPIAGRNFNSNYIIDPVGINNTVYPAQMFNGNEPGETQNRGKYGGMEEGRNGCVPFAYRSNGDGGFMMEPQHPTGSGHPHDYYFFPDFYLRIHKNHIQGKALQLAMYPWDARYLDDEYRMKAGVVNVDSDVYESAELPFDIDNFKPFVREVSVRLEGAGRDIYYNRWDPITGKGIKESSVRLAQRAEGAVKDLQTAGALKVYAILSERMQWAKAEIATLNTGTISGNRIQSNNDGTEKWEFDFGTSRPLAFEQCHKIKFTGQDMNNNAVLDFQVDESTVQFCNWGINLTKQIPKRNGANSWDASTPDGKDEVHRFRILKCEGSGCRPEGDPQTEQVTACLQPEQVSTAVTDADFGQQNGKIVLNIQGYDPCMKIKWRRPTDYNTVISTATTLSGLAPGVYCYDITDECCIVSGCVEVFEKCPVLSVNANTLLTLPSTCNAPDGQIRFLSVSVVGGTPPYTYEYQDENGNILTPVPGTSTLTDLLPGRYSVVATDAKGCTGSKVIDLLPEDFPTIQSTILSACSGSPVGKITVEASNSSGQNFNFLWDNGVEHTDVLFSEIQQLSHGTYCVTISNEPGSCTFEKCYEVPEITSSSAFHVTHSQSNPCPNIKNGAITLNVTGGVAPYSFDWKDINDFLEPKNRTGIGAGNYEVTVKDYCQESVALSFSLRGLSEEAQVVGACEDNGKIYMTVWGGTPPYRYQWRNGSTNSAIVGLKSGRHCVTITDARQCQKVSCSDVYNANFESVVTAPCKDMSDGIIKLQVQNPTKGAVQIKLDGGIIYNNPSAPSVFETTISSLAGGKSYNISAIIGGCSVSKIVGITEVGVSNVFKEYKDGKCHNTLACKGVPILGATSITNPTLSLANASGNLFEGCKIGVFCGSTLVDTKNGRRETVRHAQYTQIVQAAACCYPSSVVDAALNHSILAGSAPCDNIEYCTATLMPISRWNILGINGTLVPLGEEDCFHLRCGIWGIDNESFCTRDILPGFIKTLGAGGTEISGCRPVAQNLYQLVLWKEAIAAKFPLFAGSDLARLIEQYKDDPRAACARVVFCQSDFSIKVRPNLDFISCDDATDDCQTFYGDADGSRLILCAEPNSNNFVGYERENDDLGNAIPIYGNVVRIYYNFPGFFKGSGNIEPEPLKVLTNDDDSIKFNGFASHHFQSQARPVGLLQNKKGYAYLDYYDEVLRIEKCLPLKSYNSFDRIVGESVSQTFTRSINTSLTTLLSLVVLYFFGPEATKHFSLALLVGIVAGTYSSIFLGSPLLVTVEKWQRRGSKK
jgi:hypothetical protein